MAHRRAILNSLIKFSQLSRAPQDKSELGKLRWLHRKTREMNPVGVSVDREF